MTRFFVTGWLVAWTVSFGATGLYAQGDRSEEVSPNAGQAAGELLGKRVEQLLSEQALPALAQGYNDWFFAVVAPVIGGMDNSELLAMEALAKKYGLDSLRGEFANLLIQRIEQGLIVLTDVEKPDLAAYIAGGISDSVRAQLASIAKQSVMSDSLDLPAPGQPTEDLFWEVHVLSNRFENLHRLAAYARQIVARHFAVAERKQDADGMKRLSVAMDLTERVTEAYRKLLLNAAEYRLMDLDRAVATLRVSQDFEQRLIAAWALEDNAKLLDELLANARPEELTRESLAAPGLRDRVAMQLKTGMEYGQDVIEKAGLLRMGSFWWLRGRYGAGPLANGLLKDPSAMDSEENMFGLYMPVYPRKPVSSHLPEEDRMPGYDRRHFQTWSVEYRARVGESEVRQTGQTRNHASTTRQVGESSYFW